jgi:ubiquinone/menaquinone biosynthesis C-methylase UbiE
MNHLLKAEAHDAHCLLWDYERARQIAPYGDDDNVRAVTRELVRLGFPVFQSHKLAPTDREHVAVLLRLFDPPHGAEVLDAGCGVGAVASLRVELRPDLLFSLLNISAAQLELAPDAMPKIRGDFQDMPVPAASFDAVMFNFTLGHGLLDACFSEAARVLRPGGVLFVYDLTSNDHAHIIPRLGYRPHGRAEVEAAARRHDFTISYVIEAPTATTADFVTLFGAGELERVGLDRAWPIICRFVKRFNDQPRKEIIMSNKPMPRSETAPDAKSQPMPPTRPAAQPAAAPPIVAGILRVEDFPAAAIFR